MTNQEQLERSQRSMRRALTKLITQWTSITEELNTVALISFRTDIQRNMLKLQTVDNQILDLITDEEEHETKYLEADEVQSTAEKAIIEIKRKLDIIERNNNPTTQENAAPRVHSMETVAKLPQLNLPHFSGEYKDWIAFLDQFHSAVHTNAKLSDVQKLVYLKSCLKGEAEKLIKNLVTTSDNYTIAMNLLAERYKNDRLILRNLLRQIFDFRAVQSENVHQLRLLHSTFNETSQSINAIGRDVENDAWYYLLLTKLDHDSQKAWAMEQKGSDCLQYENLMQFLEARIRSIEAASGARDTKRPEKGQSDAKHVFVSDNPQKSFCPMGCGEKHASALWSCKKFCSANPRDKQSAIVKSKACYNCLRFGHNVAECKSESVCKYCQKRHHSYIHECYENKFNRDTQVSTIHSTDQARDISILPTAMVSVRTKRGIVFLRALIDTGAHLNVITEKACKNLGLLVKPSNDRIIGVNQTDSQPVNGTVRVHIQPRVGEELELNCLVLPIITSGSNPKEQVDNSTLNGLKNFHLADKNFGTPGNIDLLLGVAAYAMIVRGRILKLGHLCITDTSLGWIVTGVTKASHNQKTVPQYDEVNFLAEDYKQFEKFWEIEDIPALPRAKFTEEELECVEHYDTTTSTDQDGRAVVRLPFNKKTSTICSMSGETSPDIGHSERKALSQFLRNEEKLSKCAKANDQYTDFFQEMIDTNHIEEVPSADMCLPKDRHFVMPHHAVWKEDSTTTKCRAVFNGSAKSTNGKSLNDCLLVGPKQQPELAETLIKFRFYKVALSGDVTKMYRQVVLDKRDRNFHQFFWRTDPNKPLKKYRFTRVIYGVSSASYHAIRALRDSSQYAESDRTQQEILTSFFVDDFLGGGHSEDEVVKLYQEITNTLGGVGMNIRKWASNSKKVMDAIPENLHENSDLFVAEADHSVKTLGIHWLPHEDCFQFKSVNTTTFGDYSIIDNSLSQMESQATFGNSTDRKQCSMKVKSNVECNHIKQKIADETSFGHIWTSKVDGLEGQTKQYIAPYLRPVKSQSREIFCGSQEKPEEKAKILTRRELSSSMGKVFDPIGLITPFTLLPKILFQKTWDEDKGWDDAVNVEIAEKYNTWIADMQNLQYIRIPRFLAKSNLSLLQFHIFCDASEHAFGAAMYARTISNGECQVNLIAAKSRLAPRKTLSIPRLELQSMVLGTKLLKLVQSAIKPLNLEIKVYGWSDSTIALAWIKSEPSKYGVFVANRIAKVQEKLPCVNWHHVPTEDNPADHATRPVSAKNLKHLDIWWNGPEWLHMDPFEIPEQPTAKISESQIELKRSASKESKVVSPSINYSETRGEEYGPVHSTNAIQQAEKDGLRFKIDRWGSFEKAVKVASLVIKFCLKLCKKEVDEVRIRSDAIKVLVKDVQAREYSKEITLLQRDMQLPKTSKLSQLYPFLDDGILKVGGRLAAAHGLSDQAKYQMILPYKSHLSVLLARYIHEKFLHCGVNLIVSETRQQFWIIRVKSIAKSIVAHCVKCVRFNAKPGTQLMGDLPAERVNPSPPFSHVGIDLAGPLNIKDGKNSKCYVVVFVCLSTKAVHLDLTRSMETLEFNKVLRRFISRRGAPERIYSDNGTYFIGARNMLLEMGKHLADKGIPQLVRDMGINWGTIPARGPSFGGLWEAAVKSMKLLLKKSIGRTEQLTREELYTVVCQIEGILNSRPLTAYQETPNDLIPLTPSMLLNGFKTLQLPILVEKVKELNANDIPIKRYEYVLSLISEFWKRWTKEYLSTMQQRNKDRKEIKNLQEGDIVFVTEDNYPPLAWPLGKVVETYKGNDNFIRVVKVQGVNGKFVVRPVKKLIKLPIITSSIGEEMLPKSYI